MNKIYGERTKSNQQKYYSAINDKVIINDAVGITRNNDEKVKFITYFLSRVFPFSVIKYVDNIKSIKTYLPFSINGSIVWIAIKNVKPYTSKETHSLGTEFNDEYYLNPNNTTRFNDAPWTKELIGQKTFVLAIDCPIDEKGEYRKESTLYTFTDTSEMMYSGGKAGTKEEEISKTAYLRQYEYMSVVEDGFLFKIHKTKSSHKDKIIKTIFVIDNRIEDFAFAFEEMIRGNDVVTLDDLEKFKNDNKLLGEEKYIYEYSKRRNSKIQRLFKSKLVNEVETKKEGFLDMVNFYIKNGNETTGILVASHIKKYSSDELDSIDAADQYNGLLLPAPYDALFDKGLITFDHKSGKIIVSEWLSEQPSAKLLSLDKVYLDKVFLNKERSRNLKEHNINFK